MSKLLNESQLEALKVLAIKEYAESTVKSKSKINKKDLDDMVNAGILERFKKTGVKSDYLKLTNLARKEYADIIKTVTPPEKKKTKKKPAPKEIKSIIIETLAPIQKMMQEMDSKLNQIMNHLGLLNPPTDTVLQQPRRVSLEEFKEELRKNWVELDRIYRWGGRVEIPILRKRMSSLSSDEFTHFLFELEKQRIIDLQIASDPSVVDSPEDGIQHPTRGLIYYIIWRK